MMEAGSEVENGAKKKDAAIQEEGMMKEGREEENVAKKKDAAVQEEGMIEAAIEEELVEKKKDAAIHEEGMMEAVSGDENVAEKKVSAIQEDERMEQGSEEVSGAKKNDAAIQEEGMMEAVSEDGIVAEKKVASFQEDGRMKEGSEEETVAKKKDSAAGNKERTKKKEKVERRAETNIEVEGDNAEADESTFLAVTDKSSTTTRWGETEIQSAVNGRKTGIYFDSEDEVEVESEEIVQTSGAESRMIVEEKETGIQRGKEFIDEMANKLLIQDLTKKDDMTQEDIEADIFKRIKIRNQFQSEVATPAEGMAVMETETKIQYGMPCQIFLSDKLQDKNQDTKLRQIEEKIDDLTLSNIKNMTEEVLEILKEGEIPYSTQGRSIIEKLLVKTDTLHWEPCFATLVKGIHLIQCASFYHIADKPKMHSNKE